MELFKPITFARKAVLNISYNNYVLVLVRKKFPELFKILLLFSLVHIKRLKRANMQNLHFYWGHPVVALKGLRKTVEAYIIKWIISSEPPVGLKSQQDTK